MYGTKRFALTSLKKQNLVLFAGLQEKTIFIFRITKAVSRSHVVNVEQENTDVTAGKKL